MRAEGETASYVHNDAIEISRGQCGIDGDILWKLESKLEILKNTCESCTYLSLDHARIIRRDVKYEAESHGFTLCHDTFLWLE